MVLPPCKGGFMPGYEQTRLWVESLASRAGDDPHQAARDRLRNSYRGFRERAAVVANEIQQELREFTVHDVSHLDALWEIADLIAGRGVPLNPAEAFVFGGVILLHDLG